MSTNSTPSRKGESFSKPPKHGDKTAIRLAAAAGVSLLALSGCSTPSSNSSPQPTETPFSTLGMEYVRVCQNTADNTRAEDNNCEEPTTAGASPTGEAAEHARSAGSGGDSHNGGGGGNPFIWYYIGYMMSQNSNGGGSYAYTGGYNNGNVPSVGASLHGGSNTAPQKGTVYQGLPSTGGSFADSYRSARAKAGMKDGKVATIERNNMKSAAGKPAGNSSSSNSSSNSSSSNNGAAAGAAAAQNSHHTVIHSRYYPFNRWAIIYPVYTMPPTPDILL